MEVFVNPSKLFSIYRVLFLQKKAKSTEILSISIYNSEITIFKKDILTSYKLH